MSRAVMPAPKVMTLQRKCSCGAMHSQKSPTKEPCDECRKKRPFGLQRKAIRMEPGDPFELEADRLATQILDPHEVGVDRLHVQRLSGVLQGKHQEAPPSVETTLSEAGRPLDLNIREAMERSFGHDFSDVRIHDTASAARSAQDVGALAYTLGRHVAFASDQYAPSTFTGRHLLAHELTHVLQQRSASPLALSVQRQRAPSGSKQRQAPDPTLELIRKGQFWEVFKDLNAMWMKRLVERLARFDNTDLEALMLHLDESKPLGEQSQNRLAAAIGAAHMIRNGVTTAKLSALDDAMDKAKLPVDQRAEIRAMLPALMGGAATRVHAAFEITRQLESGVGGGKIVETTATAEAFRILKDLPPKELEHTLALIEKSQLRALMMNSRQAEKKYGRLKAELLRQALYVAFITRFPKERARFDVGGEENPILKMSIGAKVAEAISRSISKLPEQSAERIKEMLTPEAIATMAAFTTAYVVSQLTPAGWAADVMIGGLIVITLAMLGEEAIAVVQELMAFGSKAANARSEADLDAAAQHFATAVTKVGIDVVMAILFHKAGKAARPKLAAARAKVPGVIESFKSQVAGALKPAPNAVAITPDGHVVPVPLETVLESSALAEGKGPGAGGKKVGSAQSKAIEADKARNRPWSSREVFEGLKQGIKNYRRRTGIVRKDLPQSAEPVEGGTVAVAKTDVTPLRGKVFGGASPEALPPEMKGTPGTTATELKPANPLSASHAEAVALENLARELRLEIAKLDPAELKGKRVWVLVEQEPCSSCASGIRY